MSKGEVSPTFVDACLSGLAFDTDADDWVAAWHDAPDESVVASKSLHDFLGMSRAEYYLWTEQPTALRFILAAHRKGKPVDELLTSRADYALAARAESPGAAQDVLKWLAATGRIAPDQAVTS